MNATGRNIVLLMEQVRKLFQDTALLLKTADEYMREKGWTTRTNQCVTLSSVPDAASGWFPEFAFRFYKHEGYKHLLPFVSVIFYDREGGNHVEESLVSGGWHDYGKGNTFPEGDLDWDFARWHLYMPRRRDDGTLTSVDPRQEWPQYGYRIQRTSTLAIPLVSVTSAEELKARIIEPLLAAIQGDDG